MRRSAAVIAGAGAAAGIFALRAIKGRRIESFPYGHGIKFKKSVTVNASPAQLYGYWRNIGNLPKLFDNVLSVEVIDSTLSHWKLRVPGGFTLEWHAEITVDRPGEMIGWRSLAGVGLDNAGYIRFEPVLGGRGTTVRVALQYNPPAGRAGAALSALLGERPEKQIEQALRKFKQLMESGEIPVGMSERELPHSRETVQVASEDSFPASDPPAWTGTTGP